jgi:hypothetical protein
MLKSPPAGRYVQIELQRDVWGDQGPSCSYIG